MTRRDYVLIANALSVATMERRDLTPAVSHVAAVLSLAFLGDNPAFDRERFLAACAAPPLRDETGRVIHCASQRSSG